MDIMKLNESVISFFIANASSIFSAIIIVAAGFIVSKRLGIILQHWLEKKPLDPPVVALIVKISKVFLLSLAAITAVGQLGFQITPLLAGIGIAGVGLSLAIQGVLTNVVAGLTIIFSRPFLVGEYIELLGVYGQVHEISLFSTVLIHADQSKVIIPNRKIVGEILHNYGKMRQLDISVNVSYSSDIHKAIKCIEVILKENKKILENPTPLVGISRFLDSSVEISIKPWVEVCNIVDARVEIHQTILDRFREQGIVIPFPQSEVRILKD